MINYRAIFRPMNGEKQEKIVSARNVLAAKGKASRLFFVGSTEFLDLADWQGDVICSKDVFGWTDNPAYKEKKQALEDIRTELNNAATYPGDAGKYSIRGCTIEIMRDDDPWNPREEQDNAGRMVCLHRRYTLGDAHELYTPEQMTAEVNTEQKRGGVVLPLFLYDHSGLTMNTTGFDCQWDSGQVGYIYMTANAIRFEYGVKRISAKTRARALNLLRAEVATYDAYLRGDVYGYTIQPPDGEEESRFGFYGLEYMLEELTYTIYAASRAVDA